MVKSGSYKVKQPSLAGRLGTGFGQGLAESLPKEMERGRLSQGLQQLGQQEGLSPFQRFAQLSSIPGITPQMIQSGSELLKQQGMRESAMKRGGRSGQPSGQEFAQGIKDIQGMQFGGDRFQGRGSQAQGNRNENETINQFGQPQIQNENEIRPQAQPMAPWTPQRFEQEVADLADQYPEMNFSELSQKAKENEARYLAQPEAQRERDQFNRDQRKNLQTEFGSQLEDKLQKKGSDVYGDITGENRQRAMRLAERELKTNPNATINEVVNKYTNKLLDMAKAKTGLKKFATGEFFNKINPLKREDNRKRIESYSKIFKEAGNSEEFYNLLKSDFDLSPQGSASYAYKPSSNVEKYINKVKPTGKKDFSEHSRKYAIDLEPLLTSDDSILSIAHAIRQKDPLFDQSSFFNQIRDDQNDIGLSPLVQRELGEAEFQYVPTWGDILYLPLF